MAGNTEWLVGGVDKKIARHRDRVTVEGLDHTAVEFEIPRSDVGVTLGLPQRLSGILAFEHGQAVPFGSDQFTQPTEEAPALSSRCPAP